MKIEINQVDAFTNKLFGGNPAAVCPLEKWLDDNTLQKIAMEINLAETAFFVPLGANKFHIRWFTPEIEMDLCGHATLASAFVIFLQKDFAFDTIIFDSQGGELKVRKDNDYLELDFPSRPPVKAELPEMLRKGLNIQPIEIWKSRDYLLLYDKEEDIRNISPDMTVVNQINLDPGGFVVTAKGDKVDFVSRFFTPQASIFEDPVTASAYCTLVPFWAKKLNKTDFNALQISQREGELLCSIKNHRVYIKGKAVKFMQGYIELDDVSFC